MHPPSYRRRVFSNPALVNMETLTFETDYEENKKMFTTRAYTGDGNKVCESKISVNDNHNIWTISSWYAAHGSGHKGYGTLTLQSALQTIYDKFAEPVQIEYIWNGANQYVIDWLNRHFGAISKCPIAVQKYAADDDWESHIYILNKDKVLEYFNIH